MKAVPIGDNLVGVGFTEEQGDYLEAIAMAREMIEELTGRNMESFSMSEIIRLRPVSLTLTKMLADSKIGLKNYKDKDSELQTMTLVVMDRLREIDMLRVDLV